MLGLATSAFDTQDFHDAGNINIVLHSLTS
jgi:hypothetical protein